MEAVGRIFIGTSEGYLSGHLLADTTIERE